MQEHECVYMRRAIELAKKAMDLGEIPVGAVVVKDGRIIGAGYNLRENDKDAVAHAEIIAIRQACAAVGDWRLSGCTLYVTLEPCPMCTGAIINSRIEKVVFGAKDNAAGCCGSLIDMRHYPFNHSFSVESGVCEEECSKIIREFFSSKRKSNDEKLHYIK